MNVIAAADAARAASEIKTIRHDQEIILARLARCEDELTRMTKAKDLYLAQAKEQDRLRNDERLHTLIAACDAAYGFIRDEWSGNKPTPEQYQRMTTMLAEALR